MTNGQKLLVWSPVTTLIHPAVFHGASTRVPGAFDCIYGWGLPGNPELSMLATLKFEEEGQTWCRGWDGPAAEALRAVYAL